MITVGWSISRCSSVLHVAFMPAVSRGCRWRRWRTVESANTVLLLQPPHPLRERGGSVTYGGVSFSIQPQITSLPRASSSHSEASRRNQETRIWVQRCSNTVFYIQHLRCLNSSVWRRSRPRMRTPGRERWPGFAGGLQRTCSIYRYGFHSVILDAGRVLTVSECQRWHGLVDVCQTVHSEISSRTMTSFLGGRFQLLLRRQPSTVSHHHRHASQSRLHLCTICS